jgi:hypothetical protein
MPQGKMKLFVWEGAFGDYYPGLAVALARDVREARLAVARKYAGQGKGRGDSSFDYAMREVADRPDVIRLDEGAQPQAWQVSGGG